MHDTELINQLFETGLYNQLYKAGLVSYKLSTYRDIYFWVDAQIKARGVSKEKAVTEAQIVFECGRATIYRALKTFTKPC